MAAFSSIDCHQLAAVVKKQISKTLIIDSRCFTEYNISHVSSAVNVCCSKIVKRRLQQDKLSVKDLLVHTIHCEVDNTYDVVVYDQSSIDYLSLSSDSFITILLSKLQKSFHAVSLLSGGFSEFQHIYPQLCGDKVRKLPPLSSLSQPCLPVADQGPTRILTFLYLGSQFDAFNKELLKDHNITYELNVSTSCPKPEFLSDTHFMRIPVNDSYNEKLLPHFQNAFHFLDKVRESSGCVLVHCLAGISRSPTIAIAYVMRYLKLTSDDGYRYVKAKRPTISPNFNFLGQLLEFEKQLRQERVLDPLPEECPTTAVGSKKRLCMTDMRKTSKLTLTINPQPSYITKKGEQSPTTALAKLSFSGPPTPDVTPSPNLHHSRSFESMVDQIGESFQVKVLSPVKEIKCESLVSEISHGSSSSMDIKHSSVQYRFRATQSVVSHGFSSEVSHKERFMECEPSAKVKAKPKNFSQAKHMKCHSMTTDSTWKVPETNKPDKPTYLLSKSPMFMFSAPSPMSDSYCSRSDSATTSGFGSESSEMGKCFSGDFDFEELDDDVMLKSAERDKKSEKVFSFNLSKIRAAQNFRSPLSPSESHLVEDVSCSSASKFPSYSNTSFTTDSACQKKTNLTPPQHGKLVTQYKESSPISQCFSTPKCSKLSAGTTDTQPPENMGLYRVQSCPNIGSGKSQDTSSHCSTISNRQTKCTHNIVDVNQQFVKDILLSGSCPDVLTVDEGSSPPFRELGHNVRLISVT